MCQKKTYQNETNYEKSETLYRKDFLKAMRLDSYDDNKLTDSSISCICLEQDSTKWFFSVGVDDDADTKGFLLSNLHTDDIIYNSHIDLGCLFNTEIKYKTLDDVKNTIKKLERLYKNDKYSHKRIWQVAMIMKVRLEVLKKKKPKQYKLSKKYSDMSGNVYYCPKKVGGRR